MRTRIALALAAATAVAGLPAAVPTAEAAAPARRVTFDQWTSNADFAAGKAHGVRVSKGRILFDEPAGTSGRNEHAHWVSPWVEPGFDLTELIASWHAGTPVDSWVELEVRGRDEDGRSSWDTVASWAREDDEFTRTSPGSQTDDLGRVAYDTWVTGGASAWQLRVTLLRPSGSRAVPKLFSVGAMASRVPDVSSVTTSKPGRTVGTVLPVPRYSQMAHKGYYQQYDGGGAAWCSPTSTTMVLDYYDALPSERAYSWVQDDYPDRVVAHVARMTYDAGFGGTGNWPFNTAYAAVLTGNGFVTRLRSLREAERFIAAGIPLVASVAFSAGQLDGAPISSTNGHLMVIVGFRENGDVVVNDPASPTRKGVRRTYDRGQFEDAWLTRSSSGGVVYVIHDEDHPLPEPAKRNW
ncbi:MAG TPA: C39 family peptidase [Marmoricola sp.]|nr:C39 family peptidase [Marmoricola sp.]